MILRKTKESHEGEAIHRRADDRGHPAGGCGTHGDRGRAGAGVSKYTIYGWKAKYGGMSVSDAQKLRQLEDENRRLKKIVADLSLDKEALKSVISKNGWGS